VAGYREFQTGEVLTAANVNDFLMKQAVMVFADAAARTSALDGDEAEGMLTYNKDTGALEVYDGTAFVPAGAEPNLVTVKTVVKTDTQTFASVASGADAAITGLAITHEVADAANKLVITLSIGGSNDNAAFAINDGSGFILIGDSDGSRTRTMTGPTTTATTNGTNNFGTGFTFVHTPGAGSKTYTTHIINVNTTTRNVFLNRSFDDGNTAAFTRAVSTLTIMEVRP